MRSSHVGSNLTPGPGMRLGTLASPFCAWATRVRNEVVFADLGFQVLRRPQLGASAAGPLLWNAMQHTLLFADGDLFEYRVDTAERVCLATAESLQEGAADEASSLAVGAFAALRADSECALDLPMGGRTDVLFLDAEGHVSERLELRDGATPLSIDASHDRLVVHNRDADVRVLARDGRLVARLTERAVRHKRSASRIWSAAIDRAGTRVLLGATEGLLLWDLAAETTVWVETGATCNAAWSPTEGSIAYSYGGSELRRLLLDGSRATEVIARLDEGAGSRSIEAPTWSADERYVCAPLMERRVHHDGRIGLGPVAVVADLEGGGVSRVDLPARGTVWIGQASLPLVPIAQHDSAPHET